MTERCDKPRAIFIGRTTLDAAYRLDAMPKEDGKVYASSSLVSVGGPAANAAITHAMLGGDSLLITAIGRGLWADTIRAELSRHGVLWIDLALELNYEAPLTTVLINTQLGTRTIVNPPQQLLRECEPIQGWHEIAPEGWSDPPRVALCDGFFLRETLPLLADLRASGTNLCLDGGSWKPGTDKLAPLLHAAICSERFELPEEFARRGIKPVDAALRWFAEAGVPFVAVTRGAKPIIGVDQGSSFEIAIEQVPVVDTLAAGDVLHGAYIYFSACGVEPQEALRTASAVATLKCRFMGVVVQKI